MNPCYFSHDRRYRYTLEHVWDGFAAPRLIQWIGLNPSTADEDKLDPTLRRIRAFSMAWGYTGFVMTNLFAFRSKEPRYMLEAADPFGPENQGHITATAIRCETTVAAWGTLGSHRDAAAKLSAAFGRPLYCLGTNSDGSPKHPLYVPGVTKPEIWRTS